MKEVKLFNENWLFTKDKIDLNNINLDQFELVNIPHTWNNLDGQDGGSDYYRGTCYYLKDLEINSDDLEKELYLSFEGVSSIATVFINNKEAAYHEGGFSTFRVKINDYVNFGTNRILVSVDNSANDHVYPQFADFTFFGGIYRNVSYIKAEKTHFVLDYFGSNGIKVTPKVLDDRGVLEVETYVENPKGELVLNLYDNEDLVLSKKVDLIANNQEKLEIDNVHLWNGRIDPFLYKLEALIVDNDNKLDQVFVNVGFRTFKIDPNEGFILNGKSYPLHGVSRHQDRLDLGWAITRDCHDEDMALIKEVGANTIRLAHYQHDQYFYDLCDKEGMIIWAEIPYISSHMDNGKENVFSQMKELVIQNYNHPSIVCWGLSNEITMRGETERLLSDHRELNEFVHNLDSTRLTTLALLSIVKINSPMTRISDIISYNHYFGWYAGKVSDNGPWLDKFHETNPDICLGLSEYGCEAILDYHTDDPKQGDYSEEYQAYYHEEMLKTFETRKYLWSTHVWNMFDFAADSRDEGGKKGRNHKGLVTFDRKTRKDSFYIYKAYWDNFNKFVHICSKRYLKRSKEEIIIKVYSNLENVEVFLNDEPLELYNKDNHIFLFKGNLRNGENEVKAVSGEYVDEALFIKQDNEELSYHYNTGLDSVTNWFDNGKEIKFNYPDGYFNVNSEIASIIKNPTGNALMTLVLKLAGKKMGMDFGEEMLNMVGSMTIARMVNLAGLAKKMPSLLYNVNEIINKLKDEEVELNHTENLFTVNIKNMQLELNMPNGYLNINSKIKELLENDFTRNMLLQLLKLNNMDYDKMNCLKKFIFKELRVSKIINQINFDMNEDLIKDINNILITIKK